MKEPNLFRINMKYLKLFENLKLYQEIDAGDVNQYLFGEDPQNDFDFIKSKWEKITKNEIVNIINLFHGWEHGYLYYDTIQKTFIEGINYKEYHKKNKGLNHIEICEGCIIFKKVESVIAIYKTDDDWFYVENAEYDPRNPRFIKYYKCDQFEGLLQCLKDNFNI